MAPLDPVATSQTNTYPIALFSTQVLFIAASSAHIIQHIRRTAKSLPPPPSTRSQTTVRNRHAKVFAGLAALSLTSVSIFAVAFRVLSYFEWADNGNHQSPGGLWSGWYGTGDTGVGRWRLGDWLSDVDLNKQSEVVTVHSVEGFFYTAQHYTVLIATAIFFGVEGRRRNIPNSVIAAFVFLSRFGSLGYALNLFLINILFTPTALHNTEKERLDATFTPQPAVYWAPTVLICTSLLYQPKWVTQGVNLSALRVAYLIFPFYLAFAPQIVPVQLGQRHASKAAAHRSYMWTFWTVGLSSFVLSWDLISTVLFSSIPREQTSIWDLFRNTVSKPENTNRFLVGLSNTAEKLKIVSQHPSISVVCSDLIFTGITLLVWTFIRDLSVDGILDNSLFAHFWRRKSEKHVAFNDNVEKKLEDEDEAETTTATPKKRGRPKKGGIKSEATSSGTLRRSTRRKAKSEYESDDEEPYEPPTHVANQVRQTEVDGTFDNEDILGASESTALALALAFVGGFGQLASAVFGAEVTVG